MFNQHIKFEMSPATKKWRATPYVKILVLSHHLGDLGITYTLHLWLARKRVVDFLLLLMELFRYLSRLKRNLSKSAFSEGVGHFERNVLVDGDVARNPSMDR